MGALWESGNHAVPNLMQEMAIFFAQFRLMSSGTDSYSVLIEHLASSEKLKDTIFSSLNYECLMEIATFLSGRTVNYLSEYTPSGTSLTVWKLHGSCNFLPGENVVATRDATFGSSAVLNPGVRVVDPSEVATYLTGNTSLYPTMSIYTRGKPVQISPFLTDSLQGLWRAAVGSADSVTVIGVKPHPVDEHIWAPLATTNANVMFIGDREPVEAWIAEHRPEKASRFIGTRFHDEIKNLVTTL